MEMPQLVRQPSLEIDLVRREKVDLPADSYRPVLFGVVV
jgi:hypothetical protein